MGEYRLLGRLGAGGMGVVYLGRSPGGLLVAVKAVQPWLARNARYRVRFQREVAAARTVAGAFTAPLVDADPYADPPWLATAYLPGLSLGEAVETAGAMPPTAVRLLAAALAEALAEIHGAGLTHRDLKPGNVMLTPGGPRVIDFGIARPGDSDTLTQPGTLLGTPGFMSPEQAFGERAGPAADIFALGGVLVFAATGRGPFDGKDRLDTLERIRQGHATFATLTDRRLRALVTTCLRPEPHRRPSADELLERLGEASASVQGTRWLPASLASAIDLRTAQALRHGEAAPDAVWASGETLDPEDSTGNFAGEAEPASPAPPRRSRRLLLAAAGIPLAAAGAMALLRPLMPYGGDEPTVRPTPVSPPSPRAEILWKVMVTGGDMFNDPDVYAVGGVVLAHDTYVGDLQALEARTGDIVWATRVSRGSQLELAISRDVVYLIDPAGDNQAVHAVHAATNTTRWSWLPESGPVSAVAETGGLTFIAADRIEAVGTQDGATRWSAEAAALYLATSSGVVVASDVGELTALTAGSGSHLWRRDAVHSNAPPLVQADGGLLHVHDGETLSAIRPDDGNVAWTRVLDAPSDLHRVGAGMVFVDSPDNRLRALRADTGEPVWSRENALFFGLSGGMAFVTDLDRARLHALRPADGIVLWTRDADEGDQWGSGAVTVDGVVCVSTTSGHVQAFRPPSGGVRGTL